MESDLDFLSSRKTHTLNLGSTFQRKQTTGFHTLRYDFKPASVDKTKEGCIEVGEGNEVTLTLPHITGSKTSCTVYKGSKKPVQKECLLIYDHDTGEFTLERISSQLQVKKTRMAGTIPANLIPVLPPAQKVPKMAPKKTSSSKPRPAAKPASPPMPKVSSPSIAEDLSQSPSPSETAAKVSEEMLKAMNSEDDSQSSSSGSSDSSSDNSSSSSGSEAEDEKLEPIQADLPLPSINLNDDLQLSESSSSDSD